MKRSLLILLAGLVLALGAYCGSYYGKTASDRAIMHCAEPELAWLKSEYQLSDQEFDRISKLHEAYKPECARLCQRIADKNSELKALLSKTNASEAALDRVLTEAAQVRLDCQKHMLNHFLAVSQAMPPEQGRRYLAWVQEQTLLDDHSMASHH